MKKELQTNFKNTEEMIIKSLEFGFFPYYEDLINSTWMGKVITWEKYPPDFIEWINSVQINDLN